MSSMRVTKHKKSSEFVVTSLQTHASKIIDAFVRLFATTPEERTRATDALTFLLGLIVRRSKAVLADAVAADDHLARESGDDAAVLGRRDVAVAAVRAKLTPLRSTLEGLFGEGVFAALGAPGDTPYDPVALARFGRLVVDGLKAARLPAPRVPGIVFDGVSVATDLEPAVSELEAAVEGVAVDTRENQAALMDRDRAFEGSRVAFSHTANFTSALLALAELSELARRVRPTGRDPGTVADDVVEDAPATPADDAAPGTGTGGPQG